LSFIILKTGGGAFYFKWANFISRTKYMKREIYVPDDGSHTVVIPDLHVTYHSTFGAIQESTQVFIQAGLLPVMGKETEASAVMGKEAEAPVIEVFEMGFGTGLNALLTLKEAIRHHRRIRYQTVELYPLSEAEAGGLNYLARLKDDSLSALFASFHRIPWNEEIAIHPLFDFNKIKASITALPLNGHFHVIYYDAFAPDIQPDLWEPGIYEKLYRALRPGGILVTYCCKGIVRRGLRAAGFLVEKLPGPRGKREILRAERKE
jgi:tRNA U34 5-methylaminomethyl-2-thiouridine-forming methyltransferase MnmC